MIEILKHVQNFIFVNFEEVDIAGDKGGYIERNLQNPRKLNRSKRPHSVDVLLNSAESKISLLLCFGILVESQIGHLTLQFAIFIFVVLRIWLPKLLLRLLSISDLGRVQQFKNDIEFFVEKLADFFIVERGVVEKVGKTGENFDVIGMVQPHFDTEFHILLILQKEIVQLLGRQIFKHH